MNYIDILISILNSPERKENMPRWANKNPKLFGIYEEARSLAYPQDDSRS